MGKSPDAFRTISEVAEWLGVQTHVLRFWESKFSQVKPVKRAGGRRYYRPGDMLLLGGIRRLLHDDGLTIKGVQKILREEGVAHVADLSQPLDDVTAGQIDGDLAPAETPAETPAPAIDLLADMPAEMPAQAPAEPPLAETPVDRTMETAPGLAAEEPDLQPLPEGPAPVPETPRREAPPAADVADAGPMAPAATASDTPAGPPKPRIIDVPDEQPDDRPVTHGALSMAARARRLPPDRVEAVRPLVARLSALRDRMTDARRDARND